MLCILAMVMLCVVQFSCVAAFGQQLNLAYKDCGKGPRRAKITGATPSFVPINGKSTPITVNVDSNMDIADGTMDIRTLWGDNTSDLFGSVNCSGDAVLGGVCDYWQNNTFTWSCDPTATTHFYCDHTPPQKMKQCIKECEFITHFSEKMDGDYRLSLDGLKFPIAAGPVDITMNISHSGWFGETEMKVTSVSQSGERVFCVKMFAGKADKRGVRPLTYKDCQDSQTHGRIIGLFPSFLNAGESTRVTVKAIIDNSVRSSSGKFHVEGHLSKTPGLMSFGTLADCSGAAGEEMACHLRLGLYPGTPSLPLGTIKSTGIKFPIWKGPSSLNLELSLNPLIPLSLAWTWTRIRASTKSGEEFFCLEVQSGFEPYAHGHNDAVGERAVLV